ncbi:hypothetical protein [Corynebacterium bovis]|uniref:hypothetical protein n=1 Tax=Corynebacterium bovis TaxID=36808 RepID=UPI0021AB93E8|nr:hypothetical protein [Corynebacterium bovis]MDN8578428.1 hypothetical protein [Corynebacterium bovis]
MNILHPPASASSLAATMGPSSFDDRAAVRMSRRISPTAASTSSPDPTTSTVARHAPVGLKTPASTSSRWNSTS